MQPSFAVSLVSVTVSNVDASPIDFDRADKHRTGTNFVRIEVRIGLHTIERFESQAIGVMRSYQEIAEVSSIVRVGQVGTRRCADVPDKRTQVGKGARKRVRLEEENGMLARIWWQGRYLASTPGKIMGIGGIHCQTDLAVVISVLLAN